MVTAAAVAVIAGEMTSSDALAAVVAVCQRP